MSKHKVDQTTTEPAQTGSATPEPAPLGEAQAAGVTPELLPAVAPPPPLTNEELEALRSKAAQAQQWYDQLLRTTADFDNFRKRAVRERADAVRFANEALLQKLVPVLDNFDMAMTAADGPSTTVQSLQAGTAMIHQQLKAALAEAGLEEIEAASKAFDPNLHEAVAQEASAEVAEGHVLRQLRKGYKLRDRLLRPATVVVAKPAQPEG